MVDIVELQTVEEEIQRHSGLTGEDLLSIAADNGERYELIEGELIQMARGSFKSSVVAGRIIVLLGIYNKEHKLGRITTPDSGYYTRQDDKTVRVPDVALISYARLPLDQE